MTKPTTLADIEHTLEHIDTLHALLVEDRRRRYLARGELVPADPTHEELIERLLAMRAANNRAERNLKRRMQRAVHRTA